MEFIIAVGFILLILVCVLTYTSKVYQIVKFTVLPTLLVLSVFTVIHYLDNLGSPLDRPVPDEFAYKAHLIEGDFIYVWTHTEEKGHKLYVVPYDREKAKELEEAKDMQENGGSPYVTKSETINEGGKRTTAWEVDNYIPQSEASETK